MVSALHRFARGRPPTTKETPISFQGHGPCSPSGAAVTAAHADTTDDAPAASHYRPRAPRQNSLALKTEGEPSMKRLALALVLSVFPLAFALPTTTAPQSRPRTVGPTKETAIPVGGKETTIPVGEEEVV